MLTASEEIAGDRFDRSHIMAAARGVACKFISGKGRIRMDLYLQNKNSISEQEFSRRFRIVHNLTRNSEDEISESESRSAGNRMPAILRQVDSIIIHGIINTKEKNNFNSFQLREKIKKLRWTSEHPDLEEKLFKLEDRIKN